MISLLFEATNIENSAPECTADVLEVHQGDFEITCTGSCVPFCNSYRENYTWPIQAERFSLRFTTNNDVTARGFRIRYTSSDDFSDSVVDLCGPTSLDASSGTIFSPLYPNEYPTDTQCKWLIQAADDEVMYQLVR